VDKGIILPVIFLILSAYLLANLISYSEIASKWQIDTTKSIVNANNATISKIISPQKTGVLSIGGKKAIYPIHVTEQQINGLMLETDFKADLNSSDRLLFYRKGNIGLVLASDYFNENEVEMLRDDNRILYFLYNSSLLGTLNMSFIDVKDPTNARVEKVLEPEAYLTQVLVSYNTDMRNFSLVASGEFHRVLEDSRKLKNKSLLLYHPSNTDMNIIIPVNFSNDEVMRLAKSSAVKTALAAMHVKAGEAVSLNSTPEFKDIDIANLPHNLDAKIYVTFNPFSLVDFIPSDWIVFSFVLIAVIAILYLIYRMFL